MTDFEQGDMLTFVFPDGVERRFLVMDTEPPPWDDPTQAFRAELLADPDNPPMEEEQ